MDTEELRFSKAELAIVFQHLWDQRDAPSASMLGDLKLDEPALADARRSLIERGLLFAAPRRPDTALSPSLAPTLDAVTRPQVLGILQVTRAEGAARSGYYYWTPERVVFGRVTETGDHILETLAGVEAIGPSIARFAELAPFKQSSRTDAPDAEALVREATARGVFMAVTDLQSAEQVSRAVSWVVSRAELWLVVSSESGPEPQIRPATVAEVGEQVEALMVQAAQGLSGTPSGALLRGENGTARRE